MYNMPQVDDGAAASVKDVMTRCNAGLVGMLVDDILQLSTGDILFHLLDYVFNTDRKPRLNPTPTAGPLSTFLYLEDFNWLKYFWFYVM